jgi:hypothetical protein
MIVSGRIDMEASNPPAEAVRQRELRYRLAAATPTDMPRPDSRWCLRTS